MAQAVGESAAVPVVEAAVEVRRVPADAAAVAAAAFPANQEAESDLAMEPLVA